MQYIIIKLGVQGIISLLTLEYRPIFLGAEYFAEEFYPRYLVFTKALSQMEKDMNLS